MKRWLVLLSLVAACGHDDHPHAGLDLSASVDLAPSDLAASSDSATDGAIDGATAALPHIDVETGIYTAIGLDELTKPYDSPSNELAQIISRPYVHGFNLGVPWSALEPTQGNYATDDLRDALVAIRTLAAAAGKAVTVKVHLANGVFPDWVGANVANPSQYVNPTRVQTALGWYALGQYQGKSLALLGVATEPGYVAQCKTNLGLVASAIQAADPANASDPNAQLVRIIQFSGPSANIGGTVRLNTPEGFPRDDANLNAVDAYGFGWTFAGYLAAYVDAAQFFATDPSVAALRTRLWTFDVTTEGTVGADPTQFSLTVADQQPFISVLEGAHPSGAAGVRYMNESLGANTNTPDTLPPTPPTKCNWTATDFESPTNSTTVVANRPRHELQVFVPNKSVGLLPRFELARVGLFLDPADLVPTSFQRTEFIEYHGSQVLADTMPLADGTSPASAFYTCFDQMIRTYANPARQPSGGDQTFWTAWPSMSPQTCGMSYPAPAVSVCGPQ